MDVGEDIGIALLQGSNGPVACKRKNFNERINYG